MFRVFCAAAFGLLTVSALSAAAEQASRFRVDGARLIYDTENVPDGTSSQIENSDADELLALLKDHPQIEVIELNSTGGSYWGARRMADAIIDYELDTHVNGECSSSCARILLGGKTRTMSRGSRIGFHQYWWSPASIQRYYERKAEEEGWNTPFEFTAWVYTDTQSEVHEQLLYMVRRQVDPVFAIETLKTSPDDLWYPYRLRLMAANVLTE